MTEKRCNIPPKARNAWFRIAASVAQKVSVVKIKIYRIKSLEGCRSFEGGQNAAWQPRGDVAPIWNVIKFACGSKEKNVPSFNSFFSFISNENVWRIWVKKYLRGCWIFVIHAAVRGWNEFWDELSTAVSPLTFQRCAAFELWIYCNLFFFLPPPIIDAWFGYKL